MHFVNDVDFESRPCRPVNGVIDKVADVVYSPIRGAVNFDNVDILTKVYGEATITFAAGFSRRPVGFEAIQGFCQDSGHCGFADASRAGEKVGVCHPVGFYGIFEGLRNRLLADDVVKGLRTIFAR
jgi:hypothetical protein